VDRHPDSDTLLAFREHRLAGSAVVDVALHVGECAQCAAVEPSAARMVLEALVFRDADVREARPARRWLMAAAVAFAVLALSAIAVFLRRTTPDAIPETASNTPAPVAPVTATTPAPRVVASLADGDNRVALLDNGTIAGVALQSPRDAEDVRAVLSGRSIAIPTFIAAMPGAVRGSGASANPLRAIAPFRSAVLDAKPRFSWTPLPGAQSYRVAVFDADYEEVARSEALDGTSWTPSKPLPAGVDLSWHVVASTGAGEISSAGSDRAEAVFRVLAPQEAAEVESGEAHYRDSHLLRGLLYSRHGLLHDAEREFRRVAEQNPGSPVARALIGSVSR
jgi:hypothetical protein